MEEDLWHVDLAISLCYSYALSNVLHRTGDVIYINIFGNPMIILNSAKAAKELLDRRGAKYASRPVRTMVMELYDSATKQHCTEKNSRFDLKAWAGIGSSLRCLTVPDGENIDRCFTSISTATT